jgi:cyclopropane fatty-acyl-phospholipid synthase-like methyltransferase
LDAGSGIGAYSVLLAKRYPNSTVVGCDLDDELVAFSTRLAEEFAIPNIDFVRRDITGLQRIGDPFDLVVCIDVLEHIVDYGAVLTGFYNALRPNGMLYLHVPQANQKRVLGRFRDWQHEGHVREGFIPRTLSDELGEKGFNIIESRPTFGTFGSLAWELNHLAISRSLVLAGLTFPPLYVLALLDTIIKNERGLGISIVASRSQ